MAQKDRTLKRGSSVYSVNSDPKTWQEYEMEGDMALANHQGKRALKLYEKAIDAYGEFRREDNLRRGPRGFHKRVEEAYESAIKRIQRKHDRIEASLSGKRKYLSGKGREHHDESGLASKVAGIIGIVGIVSAAALAYPRFTGNAVENLSETNFSFFSLILFIIGLIAALYYFKHK